MGAITTTDDAKNGLSRVKNLLQGEQFREAIAKALPKHMSAERFCRIAITATMRTPKLLQCTQESLFNCLLQLSQYGLEPDGRHAHLIPYENNRAGTTECTLIIDYKGLVALVMRSGLVSKIHADVVCEHDKFDYDLGEVKTHKIDLKSPRGNVYAAYCICRMKDGTEKCEVMTTEEIEKIRSRSKAGRSGPWVTDWNEMAKKTVFRRLSKWLPLSPEIQEVMHGDDDRIVDTEAVVIKSGASKSDELASLLAGRVEQTHENIQQEQQQLDAVDFDSMHTDFMSRVAAANDTPTLHAISDEAYTSLPKELGDSVIKACEKRHLEIEAQARMERDAGKSKK